MRNKTVSALALATLMTLAVPSMAQAADNYTPVTPGGPTVSGTAAGTCLGGTPSIDYSVTLTNPQAGSPTAASLVLTDGSNTLDISLGELSNGSLSGSVPWPVASWTRGDVEATLVAGPSLRVPLSFPANCAPTASGVSGISTTNTGLPATGMSDAVMPIGIAGGVLALLGAGLLMARRLVRR